MKTSLILSPGVKGYGRSFDAAPELCRAVQASLAANEVADKLKIPLDDVHLYSDSNIVLGYLNNRNKRFSRYISRRVKLTLKSLPAEQRNYVSSSENSADIATRCQTVASLIASN